MSDSVKKAILSDLHEKPARMGESGGWSVPAEFNGQADANSVFRDGCGIFDLSHYSRIRLKGYSVPQTLENLGAAGLAGMDDDTVREVDIVGVACTLVRLENFWVAVASPDANEALLDKLKSAAAGDTKIDSQTLKVAQFALAGPAAQQTLANVMPVKLPPLANGQALLGSLMLANYIAYRRDINSVPVINVMLPAIFAAKAWNFITQKAGENCVAPLGNDTWKIFIEK